MTLQEARKEARARARRTGETRYIVEEDGMYFVASGFDMDTHYEGQEAIEEYTLVPFVFQGAV